MNDSISTLDELLSDPMVLLVMERACCSNGFAGLPSTSLWCRRPIWWPKAVSSNGCLLRYGQLELAGK